MKQPLRVGMIGTSFICDWMCDAARRTDTCEMHAIFSRDDARAKAFAEKQGIPLAFSDFEAFLNCPELDAVYVASPNSAHYRQTIAALEHGKHVLCEKPTAVNEKQVERMIARAHEKGLVMIEAIRPVYDPFLTVLKECLPRIGRVRTVSLEFCHYSTRYDHFKAGGQTNVFDASLGNAALMDLGVYCLHCAVALFGMPVSLHAGASFLENGTEAAGTVLLDYGDQQTTIFYSKVTESAFPCQIQGENGTLTFDKLNKPSFIRLVHLDGRTEDMPFTPAENNMVYELDAFYRMVRHGEAVEAYDEQTLRVMQLLDAIRRQTGIDFGECEALD
ncbi:MAG TPA: Gfo/Idh/MocA family oxidoreductase [Eubacteriales bacterium]|nr:Gfo/Idh/MocA family oxidoreductase [Eubacteriales bacterium]